MEGSSVGAPIKNNAREQVKVKVKQARSPSIFTFTQTETECHPTSKGAFR